VQSLARNQTSEENEHLYTSTSQKIKEILNRKSQVSFLAQSRRLSSESTPAWMILVAGGIDPADLRPRCFTGRAVVPF